MQFFGSILGARAVLFQRILVILVVICIGQARLWGIILVKRCSWKAAFENASCFFLLSYLLETTTYHYITTTKYPGGEQERIVDKCVLDGWSDRRPDP